MYYGYKHWTLEEIPRCFNVGKGRKHRPNDKGNRNHKWRAIVKRYGLRVEVCIGPVTNEEVCAWETQNIELMGTFSTNHSHDDPIDIGCNFTKGGEGTPGRIVSNETKAKISARLKGQTGRRLTDEHRRNIGLSQQGKFHPQTEDGARKISEAARGRKRSREARNSVSSGLRKAWAEGKRVGKPLSEEAKKRRREKMKEKQSCQEP